MKSKNPHLKTWIALNKFLETATVKDCQQLFAEEETTKKRKSFLKRIHSRLNKVRALEERNKIVGN